MWRSTGSWRASDYDDDAWSSGPAQLGYGDGDEATVVSFGPDSGGKYITTYFRHAFTVRDAGEIDQVILNLVRDDGAVVYLNGAELLRDNMPTGAVTAETTAASGVGGADESQWFSFDVPPEKLIAGRNLLAVEVHQSGGTSSDISFDLSLEARTSRDQEPIMLHDDTVIKSRVLSGAQWSALNEARFTIAR